MIEELFFYCLITTVVVVVLNWVNSKANIKLQPDSKGIIHLRMNRIYLMVGIISLLIWALFSMFLYGSKDYDTTTIFLILGIISAVTLGPGIPCLMWYLNHTVSYDDQYIYIRDSIGKRKTIRITDIKTTRLNHMTGFLNVFTESDKANIHQHLVGVGELKKILKT